MSKPDETAIGYADLAHRCGTLIEELRIARRALREIKELPLDPAEEQLNRAREIAARGLRGG